MELTSYLENQYRSLRELMRGFLDSYNELHNPVRMKAISRVLDLIQEINHFDMTLIYPKAMIFPELVQTVKRATAEQQVMMALVEKTVLIHVDEPHHEFSHRIEQFQRKMRSLEEKDQEILSFLEETLSQNEKEEINSLIYRQLDPHLV